MAWMEAATVFYLRALVDRIEPYQAEPLPMHGALGNVELWREAATLVLLAAVGWLAGRTWRQRAGYAALSFGICCITSSFARSAAGPTRYSIGTSCSCSRYRGGDRCSRR
jgi:hypothetical protein